MNKLIFASEQHRAFYESCMARVRDDSYHRAFFYLVGVSDDTRKHIDRLFNFSEDGIRPEALQEDWQTDGSCRLCLLAYNLWNGYTGAEQNLSATPEEIFCCGYAPYMLEGIKLRYPEYCRERKAPHREQSQHER